MKRCAALIELSREHHTALMWAKRAKRGGGNDPQALMAQLVTAFDRELEPHFASEEKDLLFALQNLGQQALVIRTLAEHRALRNEIERIRAGCVDAIKSFGQALDEHVRFEERELFAMAETVLFSDSSIMPSRADPGTLPHPVITDPQRD